VSTQSIRARLAKATPGPWRVESRHLGDSSAACISAGINSYGDGPESYPIGILSKGTVSDANADFIANAPTDIAFLLSEIDRLTADVENLLRGA